MYTRQSRNNIYYVGISEAINLIVGAHCVVVFKSEDEYYYIFDRVGNWNKMPIISIVMSILCMFTLLDNEP